MNSRRARVEHSMRDALMEMIAADVRDPRVRAPSLLTVTKVELNVDLSVARCYVSIVPDDGAIVDGAVAGLAKAAGFLRGEVGRRLGLRHAPELRFLHDASVDMSDKLAQILREDEDKARAAGRDISTPPAAPKPKAKVEPPEDEP